MSVKVQHNDFIIEEVDPTDQDIIATIGRLRFKVWEEEGEIDPSLFPDKIWLDTHDPISRHWIVYKKDDDKKEIVACARLTVHDTLSDSVDGYIWMKHGLHLNGPVSNISKLVVDKPARRTGIASMLNKLRVDAAKKMGAACVTSTASDINTKLLVEKSGFRDTGYTIFFPNRPNVPFHIIELVF
eukprot:TRINITY_DN1987_c0_g1_i2.p1 TRINITY_DN1987_c0_g1~~TRINITY_DN1987_c0_g1_i2.p1  ORF type:complete len:185 (+),score=43.15 TRINITY_DN1987_c0_g1_i2:68-622(+)